MDTNCHLIVAWYVATFNFKIIQSIKQLEIERPYSQRFKYLTEANTIPEPGTARKSYKNWEFNVFTLEIILYKWIAT